MKLIKLFGTWCSPCKVVNESLKAVDLSGISLVEVDVDENPDMVIDFKVRGVPTLILQDKDGNEISRKVGSLSSLQINNWLDEYR